MCWGELQNKANRSVFIVQYKYMYEPGRMLYVRRRYSQMWRHSSLNWRLYQLHVDVCLLYFSLYVSTHSRGVMQAGLMRRIGICICGSNARETSRVASGAGAVPQAARGTGRARRAFQSQAHTRLPEARHERGRRNGKPRDAFRQSLMKPRRWQKSSRSLRRSLYAFAR